MSLYSGLCVLILEAYFFLRSSRGLVTASCSPLYLQYSSQGLALTRHSKKCQIDSNRMFLQCAFSFLRALTYQVYYDVKDRPQTLNTSNFFIAPSSLKNSASALSQEIGRAWIMVLLQIRKPKVSGFTQSLIL